MLFLIYYCVKWQLNKKEIVQTAYFGKFIPNRESGTYCTYYLFTFNLEQNAFFTSVNYIASEEVIIKGVFY